MLNDAYGGILGTASEFNWTADTAGTNVTVPLASTLIQAPLSTKQGIASEVIVTNYCTGAGETLTLSSVNLSVLGLANPTS